ncbi:MAG TPA: cytosine permease [Acidimicrobiales bacterium]|nr:cytosine permease [Acidimicrobiales bacterium]
MSTEIYEGNRPRYEGHTTLEMHGMAPIPVAERYGRLHRVFTVWFTPNLVPAAFFIGTLATATFVGVGFGLGVAAIVFGTLLGGLLVAVLGTFGPKSGAGQLPLGRLSFGKSIVLPGVLQWLSTIAWDAINAIFGAEAVHILIHVPFWVGLLVVLAMQGLLGLFGYEMMHVFQKWMSIVLGAMFVAVTVKVASVGNFHAAASAHGASLVGGFILMVTLAASFVISWGAYASDYSRYMKPDASRAGIFVLSLLGVSLSSIWIEILGVAAASQVASSTSGGIQRLMGGGFLGGLALVAIWIGTVSVNGMNDYSGSLALQAAGARIKRPYVAVVVTALAFGLTMWLNTGNLTTKFENVLLFVTYWVPPFAAVQMVHWWRNRGRVDATKITDFGRLASGWEALVALLVGFGAAVPFMNTTLFVGPATSGWLHGGDIAFYVGFVVGGAVYSVIRIVETGSVREVSTGRRTAEQVGAPGAGEPVPVPSDA